MAKTVKVMISLPDELLDRIDHEAGDRQVTRSAFLREAARRELGSPDSDAIDAALERGRAALSGAVTFEAAEIIRTDRNAQDARDRRR